MDLPDCISSVFSGVTLFDDEELLYLNEIFDRDFLKSKFIMICSSEVITLYRPQEQIRQIEIENSFSDHKMIKRIVLSNNPFVFDD